MAVALRARSAQMPNATSFDTGSLVYAIATTRSCGGVGVSIDPEGRKAA